MSEKTASKKKTKKKAAPKAGGKGGGKGKWIAIAGAVLVVLAAGGVGAYYMGLIHALMGWERPHTKAELELGKPVFYALPQIRTDMKSGACKAPFLRATIEVQLFPDDVPRLEAAKDQIMDGILTYLRDQERQNVVGKEGSERLRFDIVRIIDNIIQPAKIHTILFKELIVQ